MPSTPPFEGDAPAPAPGPGPGSGASGDGPSPGWNARVVRRPPWLRPLGFAVGALLTVAAIAFAVRDRERLAAAFEALASPSPVTIALLVACVIANIAIGGVIFSLLMSRLPGAGQGAGAGAKAGAIPGRVGLWEMQALIASSTLLNYLPLRPGFFGRAAYHKVVNGIAVRHTAIVMVAATILSVFTIILLGAALGSAHLFNIPVIVPWCVIVAASAAGLLSPRTRHWFAALMLREMDVLVWAGRYMLAFALIDRSITLDAALGLAAVGAAATMIPLSSNGLGIREWAIGWAAPFMVVGAGGAGLDSPEARLADLVHRAVELITVVSIGTIATIVLARIMRRHSPLLERENVRVKGP
jgi:hypothetical protein